MIWGAGANHHIRRGALKNKLLVVLAGGGAILLLTYLLYQIVVIAILVFGVGLQERLGPELASPDGRNMVRVSEQFAGFGLFGKEPRLLGARVQLRVEREQPGSSFVNVFDYDGPASGISLVWQGSRHLVIEYSRCTRISHQLPSWKDVQITYQGQCRQP